MSLPLFEIQEEMEPQLFNLIESKGYVVRAGGEAKKTDEAVEQGWSIVHSGKEVFTFTIARLNSGKKVLIFGPLHDKNHKSIWNLLVGEIPHLGGKRLNNLADYL